MRWLALVLSFAAAALLARPLLATLERAGAVRENYRGLFLPAAGGIVIVLAALITLAPLAALDQLADAGTLSNGLGPVLVYVIGMALLGLVDDLLGGSAPAGAAPSPDVPRGWRGHGRVTARGRVSTGTLKAVGALGLALYVLAGSDRDTGEYLSAVALLVLTTNLFNLIDLRPGRAWKVFVVLGALLTVGARDLDPLLTLGLFVGPVLVLMPYDLGERAMLGDAGSNVLGAVAGLWLVLSLSPVVQLIALALAAAVTLYGEFRSISSLVERNPLLRRLDSIGRK